MQQYTKRKQKRETMYKHIKRYYSSGLSKKAFCRQENISYSTFLFWIQKYDQETKDNHKAEDTDSFIPIQFKPSSNDHSASPCSFTIEYPNGVTIHIHGAPDIRVITKLIHVQAG